MNPFQPGRPADPEVFAGRATLLAGVRRVLSHSESFRRGSALLLYGHRGSGKTSALRKIRSVASSLRRKTIAIELSLRAPKSTEQTLLNGIVEELQREASSRPGLVRRLREVIGRLSGVHVGVPGATLGLTTASKSPAVSPLTVWRQSLSALSGIPLLLVCVDDAELLDAGALGTLKTIAETDAPVPIILVVAGGIELFDRLSAKDASPVTRVFSGTTFDIGEFSLDETREALEAPLRIAKSTSRWSQSAVELVQRLSRGNPFLVQCLAEASYQDGRKITDDDVRGALAKALRTASSWLERESATLSDNDVRAFLKIASVGRPSLRSSEIISLGIQAPYIGRLVRSGVLKKLARGHYEIRKAPVIAYYHALKRGLILEPK